MQQGDAGQGQQPDWNREGGYGRESGYQQGNYGQRSMGQRDYEQQGYGQSYRGQSGTMQDTYGSEGAYTGSSGYGQQGYGQQRGSNQSGWGGQDFDSQRGGYNYQSAGRQRGYAGQGGYGGQESSRSQSNFGTQGNQGNWSSQGNQGYWNEPSSAGRGQSRSAQFGTSSGFGAEGWGQQAYRGSDYDYGYDYSRGSQEWNGEPRGQGYPGTDRWTSGAQGYQQSRGSGNEGFRMRENPWGERSMSGSSFGQSAGWQQGPHTGKGPRGYQRSDDRIREDVCETLTHHSGIDASEIDITVSNGEVTLRGAVDDRSQKRMAEDVIENLSGVKEVRNELRVSRAMSGSQNSGQQSGMTGSQSAQASGTASGQMETTGASPRTNETTAGRSR